MVDSEDEAGDDAEDKFVSNGDDNVYYGFLNVSRVATTTEITAAYKKLARLYHPDKHQDPVKRAHAEIMFSKLKKAHEVLSDPHKRAIYDCLGVTGVEEQGWEIVQRTKTPGEIREEYEELARAREERRLQARTNPTSRLQMTVNATDLFDRYLYSSEYDDLIEGDLPHFEVSDISYQQTIDAPLTPVDTATLAGQVSTRNGTGSGQVSARVRRVAGDQGWQEAEIGVGQGLSLGGKIYRKLSLRTFVNMSGSLQFTRRGLKPDLSCSLGNYLDSQTVGYLTYSANMRLEETEEAFALNQEQSGMCTMVVRSNERYHATASLQLGIPYTYFMLSYTRKLAEKKAKIRAAFKAGTFGAILEYGVEEKISDQSSLSATMVVGFPVGVTFRLKVTRANQTYLFPFHLSDEILLQPIFYGTIAPILMWLTVKKLVIEPYRARKQEIERERQRETNKERVAGDRREAEASVRLMEERYNRIKEEELARGGLVVVRCLFGQLVGESEQLLINLADWPDEDSEVPVVSGGDWVDITIPVQCCVEDSRLILWEGTKSSLSGVWDPTPEEDKWILIQYTYQNIRHQVLCPETDTIKLPKTSHRL